VTRDSAGPLMLGCRRRSGTMHVRRSNDEGGICCGSVSSAEPVTSKRNCDAMCTHGLAWPVGAVCGSQCTLEQGHFEMHMCGKGHAF
jgi:hypothetical protein